MSFESSFVDSLLLLVREKVKEKYRLNIKRHQVISFFVYDPTIIKQILKACKFKDIGNVYDYPKIFSTSRTINGHDFAHNFENFQRIGVSKKLNAAVIYTFYEYSYHCMIVIDTKKLKKFSKIIKPIISQDLSQINIFDGIDFECKAGQYIEISKSMGNSPKPVDTVKKKVADEKLVFEEKSVLKEVIEDITSFFSDETKEFYRKMEIPYKRGVILYGPPGTGKSALIRELIRRIDSRVIKIVINPNISFNITSVLSSLLRSLNGKSAIIFIEDMDSLISYENRSEFLNLLDGIDVKSGSYIIGTTNYPERIDPAFVNRAGRFDRAYKIENPSYKTRKMFFESKNLNEIFNYDKNINNLFAKYTDGLPMASLKEVITATKYTLASNPDISIEDAIKIATSRLKNDKEAHIESIRNYNKFKRNKHMRNHPYHKNNNYVREFDLPMGDFDPDYPGENGSFDIDMITMNNDELEEKSVSEFIGCMKIVPKEDAEIKFTSFYSYK